MNSHIRRRVVTTLCAVFLTLVGTDARAQALSSLLWAVTGVAANGGYLTGFVCNNRNFSPATVGIALFDKNGTSLNDPSATALTLQPNETRVFQTPGPAYFYDAVDIAVPPVPFVLFDGGTAEIRSDAKGNVNCSAYVTWTAGGISNGLIVSKKGKQR